MSSDVTAKASVVRDAKLRMRSLVFATCLLGFAASFARGNDAVPRHAPSAAATAPASAVQEELPPEEVAPAETAIQSPPEASVEHFVEPHALHPWDKRHVDPICPPECRNHWLVPPLVQSFMVESFLAQGFTWNPDSPGDRFNGPVGFNDRSNEYQLNQLYLTLGRQVNTETCNWDIGGRVDLLYGTDYFYTTALGLETEGDGTQRWNSDEGPRGAALYGLAMPQLFMEVYAPWGYGTTFKFGHFYSPIGYERVPAVENFFYSHSYARVHGEPFTHTGFLGSYGVNRQFRLHAGMTRGWDTWEDNNNNLAFLGGVDWTSANGQTQIGYLFHAGNEHDEPPHRGDSTRYMASLLLTHHISSRLTYVMQYDHAYEQNAVGANLDQDAAWYGLANYWFYEFNECYTGGLRFEWFRDRDGTRVVEGLGGSFFNVTLGLNWQPTPRLLVRPEFRVDWVDNGPNLRPFDDGTERNQILLATDVIWTF